MVIVSSCFALAILAAWKIQHDHWWNPFLGIQPIGNLVHSNSRAISDPFAARKLACSRQYGHLRLISRNLSIAGDTAKSLSVILMGYSHGIVPMPTEVAAEITNALPNVKSGTLRFWGQGFGRPYDNIHTLVSCDATDDCLRLRFDLGEVLAVWNPVGVEINATEFRIRCAVAVRWTWYYYGRPQTPENLFYKDYAKKDGGIAFRTNWEQKPGTGTLDSAATFPAVEMF